MEKAAVDRAPILIMRLRGENVVMISADEWAGTAETLHLMSSPANATRLLEGIKELDAGLGEVHQLINLDHRISLGGLGGISRLAARER